MDVYLFPVCSPDYLKRYGPINELKDLSKVVLLRHTMEPWEPWFEANLKDKDSDSSGVLPAGPLYTDARVMQVAARDGQGVALVRDVLVESDLREGKLVRLFKEITPSEKGYYAFYKASATQRPSFKVFLSWLIEICEQLKPTHSF